MKKFLLSLCLLVFAWNSFSQQLRINEVQSLNSSTLQDEDEDYPDWIELINSGVTTVNLSNYFLTDDEANSSQWQMPEYNLKPGQLVVLFASGKDRRVAPTHWTTIIKNGDSWKYIVPESDIPDWTTPLFDDSKWLTGKSGFGYGDGDDSTIVENALSIFLRKEFTIEDPSTIGQLVLHMDYDDGFVAYLNGTEIARANLGTAGIPVSYNDFAIQDREATNYQGIAPDSFNIANFSELLHEGKNYLAIQVHNNYRGSSDLSAIPFLSYAGADYPAEQPPTILGLQVVAAHTNFKISAEGDSLFLFNQNQEKISEFVVPEIRRDYSAGFIQGNPNQIYHFQTPTPWANNTTEALIQDDNLVPVFSVTGGIYDSNVNLKLSGPSLNDTVYYTSDGSDPDSLSMFNFASIALEQPTTVKARIIKHGYLPGKVITQSYFPNYNKMLPVVFISTTPENLWDYDDGIYSTGPNASANFPYREANFWMDWEKPAYVELYFPTGEEGLSMPGGLKIFGNYSRGYDQKSMAFYARSSYGDGDIDCKLFEQKPIDKFESIVFRSGGTDSFGEVQSWGTTIRDLFLTGIGIDMNLDAQAGRPCIIYLNGEYWGIYNIREKVNEHFLADNNGVDKDDIDILEYDSEVVEGTNEDYLALLDFITTNDLSVETNYNYIAKQMDVDNFIRYNVVQQYAHNTDWPGNNIKFWRQHGETGKWRWILYDVDATFGIWYFEEELHTNSIAMALDPDNDDWPNPAWSTLLLRSLMTNQVFKERFINTFADHLNTTLLPDSVNSRISDCATTIEDEITPHAEKWGGYPESWERNISRLKEFAEKRPSILREFMLEQFKLTDSLDVQLTTSGCDGAGIQLNTILLDQFPWHGIYFENVPIVLTAIAPMGYTFDHWEGSVESDEANLTVSMDKAQHLTAVFKEDESAKNIVITEIMYHPSKEYDSDDWVELYNNSNNYVNLSNWILKDSDDDNQYNIKPGTLLGPHEYLVVCRNTDSFKTIYPDVENYQGSLGFGFSSSGECVRLYNTNDELIDQVCYSSEYPWPTEPNENGNSLMLKNPEDDNSLAQKWYSSSSVSGSPGQANITTAIPEIEQQEKSAYLLKNYPNPFGRATTVEFSISKREELSICIFNLQGQLENVLFTGELPEGTHRFEWNATYKQPGIYLVRLKTRNGTSYLKMIVQH
ncbi:CotH kinase family protein [Mangrovibacterium lignilyticum]|uniref:CotH kinase family protein n=1 Tax=Mangrovibacterium lignilyticum TaxID=2668052 RepID=UPI0013D61466|nr:CotH kinase family protein [Mangrovibacterium lignilyticum]